MSLLMDALKRAETAKQESGPRPVRHQPRRLPESTLSLEPLPATPRSANANPLPDLANYIDAVDADLASAAASPRRPPRQCTQNAAAPSANQAADQAKRDTARNAFAAKQMPVATRPRACRYGWHSARWPLPASALAAMSGTS
jgi:hypothetical protein